MTEILTAIKFIKLCAWENSFARAVAGQNILSFLRGFFGENVDDLGTFLSDLQMNDDTQSLYFLAIFKQ